MYGVPSTSILLKRRSMTNKEKDLLLKDLCARLPYGVNCEVFNGKYNEDMKLSQSILSFGVENIKPYLRPMESMTDEERRELNKQGYTHIAGESWHYCALNLNNAFYNPEGYKYVRIKYVIPLLDWLNANHFDYRGLIPMGLALPAQEGMYEF